MDLSQRFEAFTSWHPLGEKVLAPARTRDAELRAAAAEYADADALLEALVARDVIPAGWLDAPAARFGSPLDRGLIAALAGDPDGVHRAEVLALECMARCVLWGARPARSVQWRPLRRDVLRAQPSAHLPAAIESNFIGPTGWRWLSESGLKDTVRDLSSDYNRWAGSGGPDAPPWRHHVWRSGGLGQNFLRHLKRREEWRILAARGIKAESAAREAVPDLIGRPFAELASPFEPLVELWSTGFYATSFKAPVIELCAPVPAGF